MFVELLENCLWYFLKMEKIFAHHPHTRKLKIWLLTHSWKRVWDTRSLSAGGGREYKVVVKAHQGENKKKYERKRERDETEGGRWSFWVSKPGKEEQKYGDSRGDMWEMRQYYSPSFPGRRSLCRVWCGGHFYLYDAFAALNSCIQTSITHPARKRWPG